MGPSGGQPGGRAGGLGTLPPGLLVLLTAALPCGGPLGETLGGGAVGMPSSQARQVPALQRALMAPGRRRGTLGGHVAQGGPSPVVPA